MTEKDCNKKESAIYKYDANNPIASYLWVLEHEFGSYRDEESLVDKRKELAGMTENTQRTLNMWIECLGQMSFDMSCNGKVEDHHAPILATFSDMIRQLSNVNDVLIDLDGLARLEVES